MSPYSTPAFASAITIPTVRLWIACEWLACHWPDHQLAIPRQSATELIETYMFIDLSGLNVTMVAGARLRHLDQKKRDLEHEFDKPCIMFRGKITEILFINADIEEMNKKYPKREIWNMNLPKLAFFPWKDSRDPVHQC